jgi:hypothetical protein
MGTQITIMGSSTAVRTSTDRSISPRKRGGKTEITEITDRVSKAGGPALLFENVPGYDMPVLMNAFGSMRRMCLALEVESLDDIAADLQVDAERLSGDDNTILYGFSISDGERVLLQGRAIVVLDAAKLGNPL